MGKTARLLTDLSRNEGGEIKNYEAGEVVDVSEAEIAAFGDKLEMLDSRKKSAAAAPEASEGESKSEAAAGEPAASEAPAPKKRKGKRKGSGKRSAKAATE